MDISILINWRSLFPILAFLGGILSILFQYFMNIQGKQTEDPDHKPHDVASDLGLQCLPVP